MPLKILIADDHPLLVGGLVQVLEELDDVDLLDPAENGHQLLERLRKTPADLVLLDLHMPKLDGLETLRRLSRQFPQVKVIIFTSYYQSKLIAEARKIGARGYLPKSGTSQTLKAAILAVAAGKTWFDTDLPSGNEANPFVDDFIRKYQITPREVEILRRIARGHTSREIGEQLFVSEFTVSAHRRNICRKLDIHSVAGLISFAKEQGLV